MELSQTQIDKLRAFFTEQPVVRAFLFGSYARGEANDLSDIDMLVELDYSQPIGLKFISMKQELEKLLDKRVDLVSANGFSPYLKQKFDQEKQLIYAR